MKIRLEEMSWSEVEEVLKEPNAVILPTGSIEQHDLHLPLNVDIRCAAYIAEQAARKVTDEHKIRVLVAPVVNYVEASTFSKFPGTIGISLDTFVRVRRYYSELCKPGVQEHHHC
jgi:creatinine amidohydrolase